MSYKKFCDRCNGEIDRVWTHGAFIVQRHDRRRHVDHDIDLCDKCLDLLDVWLTRSK